MKTMLQPLAKVLLLLASVQQLCAQSTAFTYQGRLTDAGGNANGFYDLEFNVFATNSAGSAVAGPITTNAVAISNGLFVVELDFGAGVFTGAARWLEIRVRTNGGAGFTVLAPRTAVTPTPYALHAQNVASGGVSGTHGGSVAFSNPANLFVGTFTGDGAALTNVDASSLGGFGAGDFWQMGGNAGTTAGVNFLGTTDNQPLEIKGNGTRAFRVEPAPESPNVIGGASANSVALGIRAPPLPAAAWCRFRIKSRPISPPWAAARSTLPGRRGPLSLADATTALSRNLLRWRAASGIRLRRTASTLRSAVVSSISFTPTPAPQPLPVARKMWWRTIPSMPVSAAVSATPIGSPPIRHHCRWTLEQHRAVHHGRNRWRRAEQPCGGESCHRGRRIEQREPRPRRDHRRRQWQSGSGQ